MAIILSLSLPNLWSFGVSCKMYPKIVLETTTGAEIRVYSVHLSQKYLRRELKVYWNWKWYSSLIVQKEKQQTYLARRTKTVLPQTKMTY